MTSAVIIVLREVLEAMLLICTLMASLSAMRIGLRWLPYGIAAGFIGAFFYAAYLGEISMALDGFGQEIVNASLLIGISLLLAFHNFAAVDHQFRHIHSIGASVLCLLMAAAVGMAITREGSEIYLYVYAYGYLAGATAPVLSGAIIGAGIGFSIGTFVYYGLKMLPWRRCLQLCSFVALIIAAGMMSQGVVYLSQADIVSMQEPLWDSTAIIAESSLLGELLHAAIGYEASPTLAQIGFYLLSIAITAAAMMLGRFTGSRFGVPHE